MKKFLFVALAVFGALAILALIVGVGITVLFQMGGDPVRAKTILEVDFERGLVEYVEPDPLREILGQDIPTIRDTVDALDRAATDDRVVGLVARIGGSPMGMAAIQEIRDAVTRFRASGKFALAWAETFGEFGPGNGGYYLATAFDEIWLQPSGDVGLVGFRYDSPFIAGTLEKLGVTPRMDKRHEYKNAANFYTETGFTDAHREAMTKILESRFDQIVAGIADRRGMDEDAVRAAIDGGPYLGGEAVEAGLVDGLAYRDAVYEQARESAGDRSELLYLAAYLKRAGRPHRKGDSIALIYGVGAVVRGSSGYDSFSGETYMGSDTVAAAFREAIEDSDIKAILFRVNSPGGSYVASDTIWRETVRAREAGKPVIVSMGDVAGSGGYFVAMSADKIVAHPATITGSIGVLAGKLLTREMWRKVGLTWDDVSVGANSGMWNSLDDYTTGEYERFQAMLDRIYEDFTAKVAEGRGMELARVQEVAKGRIWTGADALELGLVDELGGFDVALRLTKEAAGIEADDDVRIRLLPRPRSAWDKLFGKDKESSEDRSRAALGRSVRELRSWVRLAREAGLATRREGVLTAPVVEPLP